MYVGIRDPGSIIRKKFTTTGTNGIAATLGGSPVVSVYKDDSLTESIAGVTLTPDFDGVTGLNLVEIDTGADAFYSADSDFDAVVTAGTVNGDSMVGYPAVSFRLGVRIVQTGSVAPDAITAEALSTDAVNAIRDSILADSTPFNGAHINVALDTLATALQATALIADTEDIQARLPATLSAGRMRADAEAVSGSAPAADAVETNIGNLDQAVSTLATAAGLAVALGIIQVDISNLNNLSTAQVNAEVVDALSADTYAQPGQQAPPVLQTPIGALMYLYKFLRNRIEQDGLETRVYADDGSTVDHKAPVSDNGTTFVRGEFVTGA